MSTLTIEIDGQQFDGFVDASVFTTLDTISGQFSFTATNPPADFPLAGGETAVVRADGEIVLTGFVEKIRFTNSIDTRDILIEGRDKTADVIDSTCNGALEIQNNISLKSLIEQTLSFSDISGISVIDNIGTLSNFTKSEIESAETGQSVFEYLRDRAAKKQAFLITDGLGNIVISRSEGVQVPDSLIQQVENPNSNILNSNRVFDLTDRFKTYNVKSQDNYAGLGSLGGTINAKTSVDNDGISEDNENIRASRKMCIIAESSYSKDQCEQRSKWEANIRRVDSDIYSATVQGFTRFSKEGIWKPNQIVQIVDDFCRINDTLLINSVEFSLSENGSRTTLGLVAKDAYKVQASKPINDKKGSGLSLLAPTIKEVGSSPNVFVPGGRNVNPVIF